MNDIGCFFVNKIDVICFDIDGYDLDFINVLNDEVVDDLCIFNSFYFLLDSEVLDFMYKLRKKLCLLDLMLIFLVIDCVEVFLFVIKLMINLLLLSGYFLYDWK